jgi:tRNA pseudouridine38-40 synthase
MQRATARVARSRGGIVFEIEANRFLHHMVRFLIGTLSRSHRRRPSDSVERLLHASDNDDVVSTGPWRTPCFSIA